MPEQAAMKLTVALCLKLCLLASLAKAQDQIPWAADFRNACEMAAEQRRLVLLHFYNDNCEPCVRLDRNVFNQAEVADAVIQNYIPLKVHAGKEPELATRYQVARWPTDVVVTPSGLEVFRTISPQKPADYILVLNRVAHQTGISAGRQWNSPLSQVKRQSTAVAAPSLAASVPPLAKKDSSPQLPDSRPQQQALPPKSPDARSPFAPPNSPPTTGTSPFSLTANSQPAPASDTTAPVPPPKPSAPLFRDNPWIVNAQAKAPTAGPDSPQSQQAASEAPSTSTDESQSVPASQAPSIALDGYCPVTLVETVARNPQDRAAWKKGDPRFGAIFRGRTYLFASEMQQQKFLRQPDAFAPVLSGCDPVRYAESGELVEGKRAYGLLTPDQQLFLFVDEDSFTKFSHSPASYTTAARQAGVPGETGTLHR
jgi:protein disulfide-isomerase